MTDIINLNSIRSDNCDCNKPKPKAQSCGCHNHNTQQPCHQAVDLGDQYFKVKNLFSELRSEWQRTEARSNLGIVDIIVLEQTRSSQESGGTNEWTMTTSKGGIRNEYKFYVYNGQKGESATIEIVDLECNLSPDAQPIVTNLGTESHAKYKISLPRGKQGGQGPAGPAGDRGYSAYELAVQQGFSGSLDDWLLSLKGEPGAPGGAGHSILSVQLTDVIVDAQRALPNNTTYNGTIYVWEIRTEGGTFTMWTPAEVVGGGQPSGSAKFMYKTVLVADATEESLQDVLADLVSSVQGKTYEQLQSLGWTSTCPIVRKNYYAFIAINENTSSGQWSVVRLTALPGEKGEKGDKGDPGTPGSSDPGTQGLVGPTIRLRGEWVSNPNPCYVNESDQQPNEDGLRFIDIVMHEGQYWMLSPQADNLVLNQNACSYGEPGPENDNWIPAEETNFAYINTLIADYLNVFVIDSEEVRIHNRVGNSDFIVAGMTGGGHVEGESNISDNNQTDPVRIWAGSETNINQKVNGEYTLNVNTAPFIVRQSGKLEATNADIVGTVQANILRLGEDSFISGTNTNNSRTLPKLENNKIQMFYVLTDEMSSGTFALSPEAGDKIKYLNASNNQFVTTTNSVSLKPKKLYQLFGIDHNLNENTTTHELIWHLVEQNLASIAVTSGGKYVDPSFYDVDFYVELSDELRITDQTTQSGILLPSGKVHLSVTNRFSSDINVYVSPITLTLQYSQDGTDTTTYAYSINIENFSFSVGKSLSVSEDAGYGTKSNSYTNHIGLNCTYEANEDLAGYQVGFEPKTLTETDFAAFDQQNQNKINIKKAVISATY